MDGNCSLFDKFDDKGVPFATVLKCYASDRSNSVTMGAMYNPRGAIVIWSDINRDYYVPSEGDRMPVTFGSLSAERPLTMYGEWRDDLGLTMTLDEDDSAILDMLYVPEDGSSVLSYRIGELGDVIRVPLPASMNDLILEFMVRAVETWGRQ